MLLSALYFFIPAYASNMAPVFFKKINFLNTPVDFGRKWKGKRILGDHKTLRGFFFGTLLGAIIFEVQRALYNNGMLKNLALIDYANAPFFLGALIAFFALFGDSLKSFFKRRLDIKPGRPWIPFDQLDFLLASIIMTAYWTKITFIDSLLVILVIFFLTLIVQYTGYKLKLKDDVL